MINKRLHPPLKHPRHIPTAFRAHPYQQQVTAIDCPGEVRDRDFVTALPAPDVDRRNFFMSAGMLAQSLAAGSVNCGMDSMFMRRSLVAAVGL